MSQLPPQRPIPATDRDTEPFWTGGAKGELLIAACEDCGYHIHPPTDFCPVCESRRVKPRPVSGFGKVESFTVNHKAWFPGLDVPYVVALISLEEQDDVRLVSNIVNCQPESVSIGLRVKVLFEQAGPVWIPLFEPAGTSA